MSELYHMKVEADALCQAKTEAQAQCTRLERLVEQLKAEAKQEAVRLILNLYTYVIIYGSIYVFFKYEIYYTQWEGDV